ncbi:MAG TPA: hypothetical protein VGX76_11175 [Pirellulales bacterium]|jgi:hypothetical protein|nr:hypothetical protein [Pirellulales bacterium]
MKVLFTIPHYYHYEPGARFCSLAQEPQVRRQAVAACIAALWNVFGREQRVIQIARRTAIRANQELSHDIDLVICTTRGRHLLDQLPIPTQLYTHHATQAEPLLLGYECQAVLRDAQGKYDYYAYLEDDLVLLDPWFFHKLSWFTRLAGAERLLQPNRYELPGFIVARKVYVDGDLRPGVTARFRDMGALPEIAAEAYGASVRFRPAWNPHAGCYFLTAEQMAHWAAQPYFLDRETGFIGPLESAATLGILRAFEVYKPAREHAGFLEIQHVGTQFLAQVGAQLPLADD